MLTRQRSQAQRKHDALKRIQGNEGVFADQPHYPVEIIRIHLRFGLAPTGRLNPQQKAAHAILAQLQGLNLRLEDHLKPVSIGQGPAHVDGENIAWLWSIYAKVQSSPSTTIGDFAAVHSNTSQGAGQEVKTCARLLRVVESFDEDPSLDYTRWR